MRIPTILFALLLLVAACTTASRKSEESVAEITVRVDNRNVSSVTVYIVTSTDQIDLGLVQGLTTRDFTVPNEFVAGSTALRLVADPVGSSQNAISETFSVSPGGQIDMVIEQFPPSL